MARRQSLANARDTISIRPLWAKLAARELKKAGVNVETALMEAGLELRRLNNTDGWIPFVAHARLFELAARELKDDCFGLNFAQTIDARDVGVLAYLGIASRTLEEAIRNLARYSRVLSEAFELDLTLFEHSGTIEIVPQRSSFVDFPQAAEFTYCMALHAYRQFAGKRIAPLSVQFLHRRDKHPQKFVSFFGCPVKFTQSSGQMVFSGKALATPLIHSDHRLLTVLREYAEEILKRRPKHRGELIQKVERRLTELLPSGEARAKIIATELGMSERTFVRRLAEHGTSFADTVDHLRRDLAQKYLAQRGLPLSQITFLLGYSNQSAFSTACKRWTGRAPGECREALGA